MWRYCASRARSATATALSTGSMLSYSERRSSSIGSTPVRTAMCAPPMAFRPAVLEAAKSTTEAIVFEIE